jgi:ferredoxin
MWESMNVVHLKDQTRIVGIIDGKPPKKIEPDMQFTIQHANPEGTTHPDIPAGATVKISGDKVDRIIDRKKVALFMDQFDIDMTLCLFCGLCTEVCPTECLTMKDSLEGIEYSEFDRENLIYKFADPTLYK